MLATADPNSSTASSPRRAGKELALRPEAGFTRSYLVKSQRSTTTPDVSTISVAPPPEVLAQGTETICHGLLRDPKPGGGKPAPATKMPDPLVFYSWWNEEVATPPEFTPSGQGMGVRRQVRLQYCPRTAAFQLFADDANAALSLQIEHRCVDGPQCFGHHTREPLKNPLSLYVSVTPPPCIRSSLSRARARSDGKPVRATELHVGQKLDVLGRPMTLRSASAKTIGVCFAWMMSVAV